MASKGPAGMQVGADDPDPTPYLFVSLEQKRIDQTKPYDAKKACWVPDEAEGFLQGEIQGTKGDIVSVKLPSNEVSIFRGWMNNKKKININKTSSSLFDKSEENLTV